MNSQLLERSLAKRFGLDVTFPVDEGFLEAAYRYQVANGNVELFDNDDRWRIGQIALKDGRPGDLATMGRPGLVDDFFEAWLNTSEAPRPDDFDPDREIRLIFQFN